MPPTRRRYASKWLTLVLCEAVMMSSGTLYLFPVYSPTLKRTLDLTQEQLNFVGSAAHLGAFFSLFGGSSSTPSARARHSRLVGR